MKIEKILCINCQCCRALKVVDGMGQCRRKSPSLDYFTIGSMQKTVTSWPLVSLDGTDWCFDGVAK